jgi:hypothetical protein
MDENLTQATQETSESTQQEGQHETPAVDSQDILARANKFVRAASKETSQEPEKFNVNDIEKIADPQAKEFAMRAHKELERAYQRKFQDLAGMRRDLEKANSTNQPWTVERIKEVVKDLSFQQAAQIVANENQESNTNSDESMLTAEEKVRISNAEKIATEALRQNRVLIQRQQDEILKTKYANYNPKAIDTLTDDLLQGRIQATREDLHKASDYDSAVRRAYEMGRTDEQLGIRQKASLPSIDGTTMVTNNKEQPMPKEGETDQAFFVRNAMENIAMAGRRAAQRK